MLTPNATWTTDNDTEIRVHAGQPERGWTALYDGHGCIAAIVPDHQIQRDYTSTYGGITVTIEAGWGLDRDDEE